MIQSNISIDQKPIPSLPTYRKVQRALLAACIFLGPLAFALYVVSWNEVSGGLIATSARVGLLANQLHFVSGFAACFFLPLGYLGMVMLGMQRSPCDRTAPENRQNNFKIYNQSRLRCRKSGSAEGGQPSAWGFGGFAPYALS